uniref:Uncharacterized protein n=1 Tax=Acrobeloides nanus TaxID=290746 RepID=A0A914D454_9BILA
NKYNKNRQLDNSKTQDDQIKLINEMLGVDDYLYNELNTNNDGLKMDQDPELGYLELRESLGNYYKDEQYLQRRSSDSKLYLSNSYDSRNPIKTSIPINTNEPDYIEIIENLHNYYTKERYLKLRSSDSKLYEPHSAYETSRNSNDMTIRNQFYNTNSYFG